MKLSVDRIHLEPARKLGLRPKPAISSPQCADVSNALQVHDPAEIYLFGHVLRSAGYPGSNVREVSGLEIGSTHLRIDLPLYLRRLAARTPLNALVKLFAFGVEIPERDARAALEPLGLEAAARLGLVACRAGCVQPLVGISTFDDLLLVHDQLNVEAAKLRPDYVLGVNPAALALANLTLRRQVQSVLDVGTGCGIQALLAARHSERVIAVDTNARALNFAEFNARLNGITNVEWRLGSLFDPVGDERFDLIVSNPPYVISPETKYMFRDSGLPGDTICEAVIRQAHAFLNEDGFACVLCNWALKKDESWTAPLQRWVQGNGCDAWFLHTSTQDPLTYAALWTRSRDERAYTAALDQWTSYYEQHGIAAIGLGAVLLRRRGAVSNWLRPDELPTTPVASCSDLIETVFRTEDYLAALAGEKALLEQKFRQSDGHRVRQILAARNGRLDVERIELHWRRGFEFQAEIDAMTLQLLSLSDGRRTLGEVLDQLRKDAGLDSVNFVGTGTTTVRRLLAQGLLAPAEGNGMASPDESLDGESRG